MKSYWNGYQWKRVSDVEARFRRARGQDVVESKAAPVPAATGEPVKSLADLSVVVTPPAHPAPIIAPDLTDDDLERLTAPDVEG